MPDIKKKAVVVGRRCSLKIRIPGPSQSCRIGLSRGSRKFALKNGRLRTPGDQDYFNPAWGVGKGAGGALPGGIRNGFFKTKKKMASWRSPEERGLSSQKIGVRDGTALGAKTPEKSD